MGTSVSVKVIKDTKGAGVAALQRRLRAGVQRVLIGVPAGAGAEENGMTLAHVAAIVEFGGYVKPHTRESQVLRFQAGRYNDDSRTGIDRFRFAKKSAKSAILIRAKAAVYAKGITIPARPFLRIGISKNMDKTRRVAKAALREVARGARTVGGALELLGLDAVGAVKRYMANGEFEPNAPSTIKKKGSSRPTIDHGQLRQAITHVVESR